ncbi:MAG: hypothetical protein ABJA67_17410, partial [Chthonomonadales bacterium]
MDENVSGVTFAHAIRIRMKGLRNRHIFILDVVSLSVLPTIALVLRLDGFKSLGYYGPELLKYTICALFARVIIYRMFGLYNRYWRYASVDDMVQIVAGVATSSVFVILSFWG